jgi:hypothetical protein
VHVSFFKRREINLFREPFLRMISKRLMIDHAKSECSAYAGVSILRASPRRDENQKTAPFTKIVKSAAP